MNANPSPIAPRQSRRGSGLLLAMMVLLTVTSLVIISTDNVQAVYTQLQMQGKEQACKAAAEAVAGAKEALIGPLIVGVPKIQDIWDFAQTDSAGVHYKNHNYGQQWFGNCLVKWRIEPFIIQEPNPATVSAAKYLVNNDDNTVLPVAPQQVNQDYYHFRIAAEATYQDSTGRATCRAQAFRWIQVQKVNLFKYALFYGQVGPAGDIELSHGPDLTIRGGIHSNGAIYVGGSSSPTVNLDTGGNTYMGPKIVGGVTKPISVTGIDGIFRQRKKANYYFLGGTPSPMSITDSSLFMTQDNRYINNILFSPANDSLRNPNWNVNSMATYSGFVRTASTGATVVKTLSNIPELAGRPNEPQRLTDVTPESARLQRFWTDTTQSSENTNAAVANPILMDGLYLDYALGTKETGGSAYSTVITNTLAPPTLTNATGFAMSHKIAAGSIINAVPSKVGLIIRERPNQDLLNYVGVSSTRPPVPNPAAAPAVYAAALTAYRNYLCSQYQVFLGTADVTIPFIGYNYASGGVPIPTVSEEDILNRRLFWSQNTYTSAQFPAESLLTLNMDAVQDYLKTTPATVANPTYPAADLVKDHFNGLIYAQRTNRSQLVRAIGAPDFNRQATTPEMYTAAFRIARASDISWQHSGGTNPLGTSKLTIVTPNPVFLWGDFNTVAHNDSTGTAQTTPCALMCDQVTVLSNSWSDANAQSRADIDANSNIPSGNDATYNVALVINNWPTDNDPIYQNMYDDASAHTFVGWLEQGGRNFTYKGSVVVLNSRRYARGYNQGADRFNGVFPPGKASGTAVYGAPTRFINFNEDLTSTPGSPPFILPAISVTRQAGYVEVLGRN